MPGAPALPRASLRVSLRVSLQWLSCLCLASVACTPNDRAPRPPEAPVLAGAPSSIELHVTPEASPRYRIPLSPGEFLHLTVQQADQNLALRLHQPNGDLLVEVDNNDGLRGPEELYWHTETDGDYLLEITLRGGRPGSSSRLERKPTPEAGTTTWHALQAVRAGDRLPAPDDSWSPDQVDRQKHALESWLKAGESFQAALAHIRLGGVYLLQDPKRAAEHYRTARAELLRLGDPYQEARATLMLGVAEKRDNRPEVALELYERAENLSKALGDDQGQAAAMVARGNLLRTEKPWKALELQVDAVELSKRLEDQPELADNLNHLGFTYNLLGRHRDALRTYERSLRIDQELGRTRQQAITLVEIGWTHRLLGDLEEAEQALRAAIEQHRSQGEEDNLYGSLTRLATVLLEAGRAEEALEAQQEALRGFGEDSLLRNQAQTRLGLVRILVGLGRVEEARNELRNIRGVAGMGAIFEAEAAHQLSRIEWHEGDFEAAQEAGLAAVELVFEHLRGLNTERSGLAYATSRQPIFAHVIELLMSAYEVGQDSQRARLALELSERARETSTRTLFPGAPQTEENDPELEKLRRLDAALRKQIRELSASDDPTKAEELSRLLQENGDRAWDRIQATSATTGDIDLAALQAVLDEETLALVFTAGTRRYFLWEVRADGIEAHNLGERKEVEELASRLFETMSTRPVPELVEQRQRFLQSVTERLLQPIPGDLPPRLVFVTDGPLQSIPFAALPHPDTGEPLIASSELIQVSSLSLLAELRRRPAPSSDPQQLLRALGNPVFQEDDPRLPDDHPETAAGEETAELRALNSDGRQRFTSLPGTQHEIEAIVELAPEETAEAFFGFDATVDRLLSGELAGAQVLHVATHGLRGRNPKLSALALSQLDRSSNDQRGLIYAHEIERLPSSHRLVVLSACDTSSGDSAAGEGLLGLPRAFFRSGARSVIVSQWQIEDAATATLMTELYRGLFVDRLPPSRALQQAQLRMRERQQWRDPYFWSGLIYQGDWKNTLSFPEFP